MRTGGPTACDSLQSQSRFWDWIPFESKRSACDKLARYRRREKYQCSFPRMEQSGQRGSRSKGCNDLALLRVSDATKLAATCRNGL